MSRFQGTNGLGNAIVLWTATLGGLLLALLIGKAVAGGNFKFLAMMVAVGVSITAALAIGKNYWMLIPIMGSLAGSISVLPVPFSYSELGAIGAIALYCVHIAFKKSTFGFKTNLVDFLIILNIAWLVVAYARNPIGFRFSGGDTMGGRDYFKVMIAFGSYVVLANSLVSPKLAKKLPYILVVPGIIMGLFLAATQYVPSLGRIVYPFYGAVSIQDFAYFASGGEEASRITAFADVGKSLTILLCALFPPVSLVLPGYPVRFGAFALACFAVLISGFRNAVISIAAYVSIGTGLRQRWSDFWLFAGIGLLAICLVVLLQASGFSLPYTVQRSLSFIPFVDWDSKAVIAGENSKQWRYEMWDAAWNTDKYIKNKLLGDGFGFSAADFNAIMDVELGGGTGFIGGADQEAWLVRGSFHSGPLSTIRFVGIIGLLLFTAAMLAMAANAFKLVNATRGSPFFPWAVFTAIPVIYLPFEYYAIFGAYNSAFPTMILTAGYMKLLEFSFRAWAITQNNSNRPVDNITNSVSIPTHLGQSS